MTLTERARRHLGDPVARGGYALLASSAITSVLGLAYWVAAARLFDKATVGRASAIIAALLLVTSLGTAGLKRGVIRFVPVAGPDTRRLVVRIYLAGLGASLLGAVVVLVGVGNLVDDLELSRSGWWAPLAFAGGVAVWSLFVLEDPVLVGLRRTSLVPASNAAYSAAKLAVLVLAGVLVGSAWGIVASWVLPAAATAVVVNVHLWRRGGRRRAGVEGGRTEPTGIGRLLRFTGATYLGELAWQSAFYLTPLVIVARLGAEANAHYWVAWQIAYAMFLVSSNVTDALVAEGAAHPDRLGAASRRAAGQIAMLTVPAVALTVVAAPAIMSAFGADYRADGVPILRLLALAALPNAITTLVVARAHVRRHLAVTIGLPLAMAVLTIAGTFLRIGPGGLTGVAQAWLGAQLLTAAAATVVLVVDRAGRPSWRHAAVSAARSHRARRSHRIAQAHLRAALARVGDDLGLDDDGLTLLGHREELLVVAARRRGRPVVVRLALDDHGRTVLAAHDAAQRAAARAVADTPAAAWVPRVLDADIADGWLVEERRPGRPLDDLAVGLSALADLHATSAHQVVLGAGELDRWIHEPVGLVAEVVRGTDAALGLRALHERLTEELARRPVTVARLHGDPSPDNLMVDPITGTVEGLIDWEASHVGLPETDAIALVLAARCRRGEELGDAVVEVLADGWRPDERAALGPAWSVNAHLRPTTLVLLAWLGHVATNLRKTDRYRRNRWWLRRNVEHVLTALATPATDRPVRLPEPLPPAVARRRPVPDGARRRLRLTAGVLGAAALAAHLVDAPTALRVPLVVAAVLVAPALVLGRCLGMPGRLLPAVIGAIGALALNVVAAEALLYAGWWSPGLLLAVVSAATVAATGFIPAYRLRRLPGHEPEAASTPVGAGLR